MKPNTQKIIPTILYIASIVCFVIGLTQPIMTTTKFFGWSRSQVFLHSSIQYFLENGELFIGILLFFFTFIFPILKYLFLGTQLIGWRIKGGKTAGFLLEIINKWAMLDVFVVALIIVNMKMESAIIKTSLNVGTTFFAISIVLMMLCSLLISRWPSEN